MPHRKASWAIIIWTILMAIWLFAGVGGAASGACIGMTGDQLNACRAGATIGGGIAVTFIIFLWFLGFVVLSLIWFMSRPKENVVVYGPAGQQVTTSEKEARKRVEVHGWTYQKPG